MKKYKEKFIEIFGYNEPFFIEEAKGCFSSFSDKYIYKVFDKMIADDDLVRYDSGIYYIPTKTKFGLYKVAPLKVIERKYIKDNNDIFGIYSGMTLLKKYNLTTQMPNVPEIITNKETNIKRQTTLGNTKVILRRPPSITITTENANYLEYLEIANFANQKFINTNIDKMVEIFKINNLQTQTLKDIALKTNKVKPLNKLESAGVMRYVTQR